MADVIVKLREEDVKGAVLPDPVVEDNDPKDLVRWLNCRGFAANTSSSKKSLVDRVKDLQESGLSKFILDPDGSSSVKKVLTELKVNKDDNIPLPLLRNNKYGLID